MAALTIGFAVSATTGLPTDSLAAASAPAVKNYQKTDPRHTDVLVTFSGTYTGGTVQFLGSMDGTNAFALGAIDVSAMTPISGGSTVTLSPNGIQSYRIPNAGGIPIIQVNVTALSTGTLSMTAQEGTYVGQTFQAGTPGGPNIAVTGSILSTGPTGGIGYAAGAGGAVTQITSRTTGVTINDVTGAITLVSAAGSATPASFTVTDSAVAATDTVVVSQKSGTDLYEIFVTAVGAGSFKITSFTTGGTTTEQPVFNFVVIKGAAS